MKMFLKSTIGTVAAVMVLFAAIALLVAKSTSDLMVSEATKTVRSIAKNTTGKIDRMMDGVETAVANQKWIIHENLSRPDYMYRITRELVENNEYIVGSTVAFRSNYYADKGHFFAPYTYRDDAGALKSHQLGTASNDYFTQSWYTEPMKSGGATWSEPYFDEGGGKVWMSTFSMPVADASGTNCAIFTADLSLQQLTETVKAICPIPNSYAVLHTGKGAALVDAPEDRTISNGDGRSITIRDQAKNGWTTEIVCPIEEILRGSRQLLLRIGLFSALGLGFIVLVSLFFSARLQRAAALRERMASELNTARRIQSGILTKDFPENVHAILRPAREVGGDLYDFVRKGDRLFFIVGDASGKGVPAALFSFMTDTVFRMACDQGLGADAINDRINQALAHNNETSMFVTTFVGILDLKTGALSYSSAGHNPPVVIGPDGSAAFLEVKRRPPTGAMAGLSFFVQETTIAPGSTILVYTDGVTEAERADPTHYGDARLLALAHGLARREGPAVTTALLTDVDRFVAGAEQSDDITIMAVTLPA